MKRNQTDVLNRKRAHFGENRGRMSAGKQKRARFEKKCGKADAERAKRARFQQKCARMKRQALEYEKALPRKGKVFQMKCLTQPNVWSEAKNKGHQPWPSESGEETEKARLKPLR